MRSFTRAWFLPAVILATGCLAAGCGSAAQDAAGNLASKAATATASPEETPTGPSAPTVTRTPTARATVTATATVTASAAPAAPGASPTATGSESSSGSTPIWPWILLGVAVLAALTGWIVHASRRRSATAAGWQSRLIDAYAKGSALHDAMSVAESPGQFAAPDAAGRWTDIQRRADDLTQELYSLREAVPDDGDRARIADTLVSLQAARSAMDAERAPGGPDPRQAEVVRGRLDSFEMSLRALRAGDAEYR
jgi:hypothetical protein